jgi:predicted CXXCH cytochrome family protein
MTQPATPDTVEASFNGESLSTAQETFTVQNDRGLYWMDLSERHSKAAAEVAKPAAMRRQIDMITGSHHMQVFWVNAGRGDLQLGFPFTWLRDDRRWVPRGDTFLRDPSTPPPMDTWNMTCIRCHTTAGQPRPDRDTGVWSSRVGELGIGCEACHGPGEAHALANGNAFRRLRLHLGRAPDSTIVQPARLDHVKSSEICGNCHSIKWYDAGEEWKQNGFKFRPGEDLAPESVVLRPAKLDETPELKAVVGRHPEIITEFFWPDGMPRVSGREYNGLIESPCYQKGRMGCLSCHSMHESDPANQLARGKAGNEACLQCHTAMRGKEAAHTRHGTDSAGGLCVNCHMPYTTYGLLKAIRSHQIDSPNLQTSRSAGRPNACNLCHLDKTLAWTAEHLKAWGPLSIPALTSEDQTVSAAVLWALKGDAGQRALIAWSLGWEPARLASGENWIAPTLARLLDDPYSVVRYIAQRSLARLPGFAKFHYDYVGPPGERAAAAASALRIWTAATDPAPLRGRPEILFGPDGRWRAQTADDFQSQRDNRPVHLRE